MLKSVTIVEHNSQWRSWSNTLYCTAQNMVLCSMGAQY